MLKADLVTAALDPDQVTSRGISPVIGATNGTLALIALSLLGGTFRQRQRLRRR